MGSAAARRSATVHWRVAARVALAWLLTLPGAALVGAFAARLSATGTAGIALVVGLLLVSAAGITACPGAGGSPPPTSTTPRLYGRCPSAHKETKRMSMHWGSLLNVLVVSVSATVAVVSLVTLGLVGLSGRAVPTGRPTHRRARVSLSYRTHGPRSCLPGCRKRDRAGWTLGNHRQVALAISYRLTCLIRLTGGPVGVMLIALRGGSIPLFAEALHGRPGVPGGGTNRRLGGESTCSTRSR